MIVAAFDQTLAGWRETARRLLAAQINPAEILWSSEATLFDRAIPDAQPLKFTVPREFAALAEMIACHREESRWASLYRVLYRIVNGQRHLLAIDSDPDVNRLYTMRKQVAHDMHRMKAFVRFREVEGRFVAWHRPDHLVLDALAPWFVQRFGSMRWSILTRIAVRIGIFPLWNSARAYLRRRLPRMTRLRSCGEPTMHLLSTLRA